MAQKHQLKVLIATLFSADAVLYSAHKLSPDRIYALVNETPVKEQEESLNLLKGTIGKFVDIKALKVSVYDIVSIASKVVGLIDSLPNDAEIYLNVTAGRKTQAIGLLLAGYARSMRIKKIAYNPEEAKSEVVYLPKISFNLNNSQRKILDSLFVKGANNIGELAIKAKMSKAMAYRTVQELKDLDFITVTKKIELSDAGRIARL